MLIKLERVPWTLRPQPSHHHLHWGTDAKSTSAWEDGALPTQELAPTEHAVAEGSSPGPKLNTSGGTPRSPALQRCLCHRGSPVKCHLARAAPLATVVSHDLVLARCTPVWRNNQRQTRKKGLGETNQEM